MTSMSKAYTMFKGELRYKEPMSKHTSWHVGGAADQYFIPSDLDDMIVYISGLPEDMPITFLGLGSNILVRDGGIRGSVIAVIGILNELSDKGDGIIRIGAGVTCAKVARYVADKGFAGAEFFSGIPGTMGGALAMNAGAFGSETWNYVENVETINRKGVKVTRDKKEFEIGYRRVTMPVGEWFIAAELRFNREQVDCGREKIRDLLARRASTQPTNEYSCGSVFKNPDGEYAGRLIDKCGLKGYRIGGAVVSVKHANFIINEGSASARDIEELINHVQRIVVEETGVRLETEVRILGEEIDDHH